MTASQPARSSPIAFTSSSRKGCIEVSDSIKRSRFSLYVDDPSHWPGEPTEFLFPVDQAIRCESSQITLPTVVAVHVRNDDGEMLADYTHSAKGEFPEGSYCIDVAGPMKLYLEFEGAFSISSNYEIVEFDFERATTIHIGGRSNHQKPAFTIETTRSSADIAKAVSLLATSLKTLSPERSFPSLRGHPPLLKLGDSLKVPQGIDSQNTGVTIEVEPELTALMEVAPLAYYTAADVTLGPETILRTNHDGSRKLGVSEPLHLSVQRLVKHFFLLDCVVRTEGLFKVDLIERDRLAARVNLPTEELYEAPMDERIARYLDYPFELFEDIYPRWSMTAHVEPTAKHLEALPYLLDDFALIRTHQVSDIERPDVETSLTSTSFQSVPTRSDEPVQLSGDFVIHEMTDAFEDVWLGNGISLTGTNVSHQALSNHQEIEPSTGDIGVRVVCNDPSMLAEYDMVDEIYGTRSDLSFDVGFHQSLTKDGFADVLREDIDFLHFIGHVNADGFTCADGKLDVASIDHVGVKTFFLNACESYRQGQYLVGRGSSGGIVTVGEVIDQSAISIGLRLARLLNNGFPLYAALDIAEEESLLGTRYTVVGDGRAYLTPPLTVPWLDIVNCRDEGLEWIHRRYPSADVDNGSLVEPIMEGIERQSLLGNEHREVPISADRLLETVRLEDMPVRVDGALRWSTELTAADLG